MKCIECASSQGQEMGERLLGAGGRRDWELRFSGSSLCSEGMKALEMVVVVAQQWDVICATELHPEKWLRWQIVCDIYSNTFFLF